jgi:hypothetical protein
MVVITPAQNHGWPGVIAGRVLHVDGSHVWRAEGATIWHSNDGGGSWRHAARVAGPRLQRVRLRGRLMRRLARGGIHHFLPGVPAFAVVNRLICAYESASGRLDPVATVRGSRPLAFATDGELICYGEYRRNPERSPVHVWGSHTSGGSWEPLWRFTGVRHVHGVYFDRYTPAYWVTTGDTDAESGLWYTADRFRTLDRVAGGSQQRRAVQLLFSRNYVYFGSDSPDEANHLYRLERGTGRIEQLQPVGSSVFHGCKVGSALFFSTAVEPSTVNRTRRSEVWASRDGDRWQRVLEFVKDPWPMRYFQYGQVQFPAGPGDDRHLWYTPFAVQGDQVTRRLTLAELGLP